MSKPGLQGMVRRVDLFSLRLFLTAIEEGQIGRAALRENIVPSAATRRIQELEDLAGARLFERSARGVVPSAAGLVVARHARTMLAALDSLRGELAAFADGRGDRLTLAAPRLLMVHFLAAEIGGFARRFPQVEIELHEVLNPEALRALAAGEVDLAAYSHGPEAEACGIASAECRRDSLLAVLPIDHPLTRSTGITLETLLKQDLIGVGHASTVMASLRHAARAAGRELRLKHSVSTVEAARSLVGAGLGVALQPACMSLPDAQDRVATVPVLGAWAVRSYRIGWLAGRPLRPAAAELVAQLAAAPCTTGRPEQAMANA